MTRTFSAAALVLRVRSSGESNREASFLSARDGIISATLYGGPKSRLRAHVAPFHSGTLWIYRDPAKDFRKVSDFDVHSWRPGLRELYERSAAASAVLETVLAGCGGGWEEALVLAEEALDALEPAGEELCRRILVHFLWRWAGFLGVRPALDHCASCAREADGVLWFVDGEGLLCKNCAAVSGKIPAGPGSRRWLLAVEGLPPASLGRVSLDASSMREAEVLAAAVLGSALGKRSSGLHSTGKIGYYGL
jgi:DNA repair protein RecO (recombination protein O)